MVEVRLHSSPRGVAESGKEGNAHIESNSIRAPHLYRLRAARVTSRRRMQLHTRIIVQSPARAVVRRWCMRHKGYRK